MFTLTIGNIWRRTCKNRNNYDYFDNLSLNSTVFRRWWVRDEIPSLHLFHRDGESANEKQSISYDIMPPTLVGGY